MKWLYAQAALIVLATAAAGCSTSTVQPEEYSGFMGDYSRLTAQTTSGGAKVMRWMDPQLDLSKYRTLYVQPSQFYPAPQPTERISRKTLQDITRYYDAALKRELDQSLTLVSAPGPDSLIFKPAITAISAKTEGLKAYEVIPVALVVAAVSTASGARDQEVVIATEAELIDAQSGKVIAQVVRKGTGQPLENTSEALTVDAVKPVLDGWAKDMHRTYLELKNR
ncbi:hypothetical protein D3C77_508410 [compost metagenome]